MFYFVKRGEKKEFLVGWGFTIRKLVYNNQVSILRGFVKVGIMSIYIEEKLLILTKTYPTPSRSYRETVCVAAINERKEFRRLYPILYRDLEENKKFKRWQWINAKVTRASSDRRPESYHIDNDSISIGKSVDTSNAWSKRLSWIQDNVFESFEDMEMERIKNGTSLGIVKPISFSLIIKVSDEKEWTKYQLESLVKDGLFDQVNGKNKSVVAKIPFDFYYEYQTKNGCKPIKHKIIDWEAGALYWKCIKKYGTDWENKFREKYENQFRNKDLYFLLGTQHRFPDQWMLIGIFYPPKGGFQPQLFHYPEVQ